jgi:very-short-patch-repair endonuclease
MLRDTGDRRPLRQVVFDGVMARLQPKSRAELPALCDAIGLPAAPDDPALSKREYIESRLKLVPDQEVVRVGEKFLATEGADLPSDERYALEEGLWSALPSFSIPKKQRHLLARALEGTSLFINANQFVRVLKALWVVEGSLDVLHELFGQKSRSLLREIEQHVILSPDDWSAEYLFDRLGLFEASDRRVARFIEALVSPDVRPDEADQRAFADRVNGVLRDAGVELREVDTEGGYPIFRITSTSGPAGRPKNLIFASQVKPDLRIRDAINNDVEVVTRADQVLIYDRPIPAEGLLWRDLQAWWAERERLDAAKAKATLYRRLLMSLPSSSPPQRRLFETYFKTYRTTIPSLPALLPEVWLHWDAKTVRERGADALLRFRMDFLMLFPHDARVVIEVDGKQHYTDDSGRGDPARYAAMVQADRDLRLAGYEVYRFGSVELLDQWEARVKDFFDRLFRRLGVVA